MNKVVEVPNSGERLSFFQLFSEKHFKVEIPIIQRDYAQGRSSESEVRDSFLDALHEYLEQGIPHRDLDFVYGSLLGNGEDSLRFVPLDGQQRLTTLFLLHWYLAQISGNMDVLRSVLLKNNKAQFSYETRTSSSEFCDALMTCDIKMDSLLEADTDKKNSLSKTIHDKGWFYLSWSFDPTIQSMLTMLDAIHAKFYNKASFFQMLVDIEKPVITFLFLNFKTFKLTDDLYIKMNARGKPLTPFENFKAKLEQKIKTMRKDLPSYQLSFSDKPVDGYEFFIHKIDTDWADVFWAYRNELSKDNTYDDELMNFMSLVIASHSLLGLGSKPVNLDDLLESGGRLKRLSYQKYDDLGCLSEGLITQLITIFNLIYNDGLDNGALKTYLQDNSYYSEKRIFKKVIRNSSNYQDKLRFYAFYNYLTKEKNESELLEWMRVVYNLTENTILNNASDYKKALISIDQLIQEDDLILDQLTKDCVIDGFSAPQVLEEKIKAHLMRKSIEWVNVILKAERHPFMNGQIGFILSFSGILEFYREKKSCDWNDQENTKFLNAFKEYSNSSSKLFTLIKDSSESIDYLWERAVLSKGVYFTKASVHRFNLLSTRLTKNNIERDHSWKRLLRISMYSDAHWEIRQEFVKAVFDDVNYKSNSVRASLENICNEALKDDSIEAWRKYFIRYPELFRECYQGFIVKNDNEIILLHQSQRNHYHSELFSKVLDIELKKVPKDIYPFKQLPYEPVKSIDHSSFVSLGKWIHKDAEYNLEVWYESNVYKLFFYGDGTKDKPLDIIAILEAQKFISLVEEYDGYKEYDTKYEGNCKTMLQVIELLKNLCSELRGLIDE